MEAIASAVPNDNATALKIRLFSTSVTSTCQTFASDIVVFFIYVCFYKILVKKKMSQVAVMRLSEASRYAIYEPEHHSEAKAWSVTVAEPAKAEFHHFEPCENSDCRYKTTEYMTIAINTAKNVGEFPGTINMKFEELDADGNPLEGGLSLSGHVDDVPVGGCVLLSYTEEFDALYVEPTDCEFSGMVILRPRPVGTYYFGMKTWSSEETEPPYPPPTAALGGAEVLPVAGGEGIGLAIPVTVVSGVALVGLAMLARKKRLF